MTDQDLIDIFLSYARSDGEEHVARLYRDLKAASNRFVPWRDSLVRADAAFDRVIEQQIRRSDVLIVVLTQAVPDRNWCRREIAFAQLHDVPVMVANFHHGVDPMLSLAQQSRLDFAADHDTAWAKLVTELSTLARRERVREVIDERLRTAEHGGPDARRAAFVEDSRARQEQERLRTADPEVAERHLRERIRIGVGREGDVGARPPIGTGIRLVNEIPAMAQTEFRDRVPKLAQLDDDLCDPAVRLVFVTGASGIGKTAFLGEVRRRLHDREFRAPAESFVYLAVGGYRQVNTATLLHDLGTALADEASVRLGRLMRQPTSWRDRLDGLLNVLGMTPIVVALDDADGLYDEAGNPHDDELHSMITELVQRDGHHVRLLLVAERVPPGMRGRHGSRLRVCGLDEGLPVDETRQFLRGLDPTGILQIDKISEADIRRLSTVSDGNPRFLELVTVLLLLEPDASIAALLDEITHGNPHAPLAEATEELLRRIIGRLDRTQRRAVQALSVYGRPVRPEAVDFLLQEYMTIDSAPILAALARLRLIRADGDRYFLPPRADVEHLRATIPPGEDTDWLSPHRLFTLRFLRSRAADYFGEVAQNCGRATRIDELQPYFNEIDLRIVVGDLDRALTVMAKIDDDYLLPWGQSKVLSRWRTQIGDRIPDQRTRAHNASFLHSARAGEEDPSGERAAGLTTLLRQRWAQRRPRDRVKVQGQLADQHVDDGLLTAAAAQYRAVIWRCRLHSMRLDEASARSSWAICQARLGRFALADRQLRRARRMLLPLAGPERDALMATALLNHGWIHGQIGRNPEAMDLLAEGLSVISGRPGSLLLEGRLLDGQAALLCDENRPEQAVPLAQRAAEIAVRSGNVPLAREANVSLALAYLGTGDLMSAQAAALGAAQHPPGIRALGAWAVHGLVLYRLGKVAAAQAAFHTACTEAWLRIEKEPREYLAHDAAGLSLAGLAICGERTRLARAVAAYHRARAIAPVLGARRRCTSQLQLFGESADQSILSAVRHAADDGVVRRRIKP